MDFQTFALSNGPFLFFNIVTVAFYMFCMVCPLHGEKIKQPLKLLLGSVICCKITYMVSVIAVAFSHLHLNSFRITQILSLVVVCSVSNNMTSSVWLNFFYCSQIVPAQRALFIWIKKNVKSIIYCFWITERIYSLFNFTSMYLVFIPLDGFVISNNSTVVNDMPARDFLKYFRENVFFIVFSVLKVHFVFCLCVMVMSSGSTVFYLSGHMHRMVANGQPLSCPQLRNQVRVTVTGILQGVLYVFCAVWTMYRSFPVGSSYKLSDLYTDFTVINLYMSGTLFNLGVGQAVFRQRAAHIWLRAAQCCKAPQVQQSEQGV
ncbi:taste receptor type 2 member 119-like [Anarrhichthys ocellatus]|uniref:taste receptor type 2 member 119-like n=1 Tax=Anarrhichthys ocellatus TaxID=433405 RepID=UPI0012EEC8B0|nr:taste receptor type 2 member 119-like [Anarrhichthys ocellatus]